MPSSWNLPDHASRGSPVSADGPVAPNSGDEPRTVHVSIAGRVQGVGYRAWVEDVAADLNLRGWVRNRRDGTVEAVFSGAAAAVRDMLERCKSGPPAARVTEIRATESPDGEAVPPSFEFRPTTT
jgi:acylphosphatase